MKKIVFISCLLLLAACQSKDKKTKAFVPQSSGNINNVVVVMPEEDWHGSLGSTVRDVMQVPYEGLPTDEPQFSVSFLNPKAFSGFTRQSRNLIWFQKDSISRFQLIKNRFAKPQILANITGEDTDIQSFNIKENAALLRQTMAENERIEKLRRIKKSRSKKTELSKRFGIDLIYPTAYQTLVDTTNFTWIQKQVQKGHLNLIIYTLPLTSLDGTLNERIIKIRDSIGKLRVPGRLDGSYLITEKAFRPYFYKTILDNKTAYLTKGTWEVKNDFMAGPFINYMVKDTINKKWLVLEGFTFAPSMSKRDYMFELNTIIGTLKTR